jgi:hypothetical protein
MSKDMSLKKKSKDIDMHMSAGKELRTGGE